jgi:hypothetical protein
MDYLPASEQFAHARVIIGIVTGFSMARLLTGIARLVQRPARDEIYSVHLGWAIFLLLAVTHFWWFEYGVSQAGRWSFGLYMFTILYAALFFFTCVILLPDRADLRTGYAHYFHAQQVWFYGLMATLFVADVVFTALKGTEHLRSLGPAYPVKQGVLLLLALAAPFVRAPRFHGAFAAGAILSQVWWILRMFGLSP